MSRVYDAMRRKAAEEKGAPLENESASNWDAALPIEDDVLPELQAEAAVTESVTSSDRLGQEEITPVSAPAPPVARVEAPSQLFEHVDMRYRGRTVLDATVAPQSREQYRRVAASLHHAQAVSGIKVVMVTSAVVGEGKTLTASNLAMTLSESYQKEVLLVDADFRRPSVHAVFGIPTEPGLAESLTSEQGQKIRVRLVSSRLGVLTGGRPTSDPIAALTSDRMRMLVQEARNTFDWIVLDTPPVALLTDANLVSSMTDGALIVVKAGETPWDLVERAVQAVGRERTLGVVLNRATSHLPSSGYYDYSNYYSAAALTTQ